MKKNKKTRVKIKYSVLCLKRVKLIDAAVFLVEHNIWALVKGKQYLDGRLRFLYNGKEYIADRFHNIPAREGLDRKRLKEEVIRLNIQSLEQRWPKPKKKFKYRRLVAAWDMGLSDQIIADQA